MFPRHLGDLLHRGAGEGHPQAILRKPQQPPPHEIPSPLLIVAPKAQTRKRSAMFDDKERAVRFEEGRKVELL